MTEFSADNPVILLPSSGFLRPHADNFVARPWGGRRLREFKGMHAPQAEPESAAVPMGESFEIAAFDADPEAQRYPSFVGLADGSRRSLPGLLAEHGRDILGPDWIAQHGACIPLLPKFLNVRELLSVQGHPPGHTEVYVITEAEPGATLRLGFRRDMDKDDLRRVLGAGLRAQQDLSRLITPDGDFIDLHRLLSSWFSDPAGHVADALMHIGHLLIPGAERSAVSGLLEALKSSYWFMLDAMNVIELEPGMVIHNTNPDRLVKSDARLPAAEVHALGNPEGLEFIALEIRKPGPTLRAWDNVRFPQREVDLEAALEVLNLTATSPADFIVTRPADGADATRWQSVSSPFFSVEHLLPAPQQPVVIDAGPAHCLHVLAGAVIVLSQNGGASEPLQRGESLLVVPAAGRYQLQCETSSAHVVRACLP